MFLQYVIYREKKNKFKCHENTTPPGTGKLNNQNCTRNDCHLGFITVTKT